MRSCRRVVQKANVRSEAEKTEIRQEADWVMTSTIQLRWASSRIIPEIQRTLLWFIMSNIAHFCSRTGIAVRNYREPEPHLFMKHEVAEVIPMASTSASFCFGLLIALNSADVLTTHFVSQQFSTAHLPHVKASRQILKQTSAFELDLRTYDYTDAERKN